MFYPPETSLPSLAFSLLSPLESGLRCARSSQRSSTLAKREAGCALLWHIDAEVEAPEREVLMEAWLQALAREHCQAVAQGPPHSPLRKRSRCIRKTLKIKSVFRTTHENALEERVHRRSARTTRKRRIRGHTRGTPKPSETFPRTPQNLAQTLPKRRWGLSGQPRYRSSAPIRCSNTHGSARTPWIFMSAARQRPSSPSAKSGEPGHLDCASSAEYGTSWGRVRLPGDPRSQAARGAYLFRVCLGL